MKKDLPKGQISREAFQQWLNTGTAPLTVESGSGSLVTVLKLSKTPEIDYLYGTFAGRQRSTSVCWNRRRCWRQRDFPPPTGCWQSSTGSFLPGN